MHAGVRLELHDALHGEDVRHDFALTSVLGARPRVEEPAPDGDERVVEVGLGCAVSVRVDVLDGLWVADGDMVWCNANKGACRVVLARQCQYSQSDFKTRDDMKMQLSPKAMLETPPNPDVSNQTTLTLARQSKG